MEKHIQSALFDSPEPGEPLMADSGLLLDLVMRTLPIGSWRVDVASGKVWWSERIFDIHGLPFSDGPVDLDAAIRVYHPTDAKTVAWLILDAIENKTGYSFVLRLKRADGEQRLVQSVASVQLDDKSEVTTLSGIFQDVTERYTEKDVAESRGHLVRSIISNTPSPTVVLDRNLCYLEISPSWIDYYDLPPRKELIGKSHDKVMPELPEEFRRDNARALAGEVIHSRFSLDSERHRTEDHGAAIFPWHTKTDEIGGIIVMLTPPGKMHAQDSTLTQLASLIGQTDDAAGDWASLPRKRSVRRGEKW